MRLCERMYVIIYSYERFPVYMYGVRVMGMRILSCVLDLYVYVCTRLCTYMPICVSIGMPFFCFCKSVCVYESQIHRVSISMLVHVCVFEHFYVYVCVFGCICMCEFMAEKCVFCMYSL